jgi:hypothetical protein
MTYYSTGNIISQIDVAWLEQIPMLFLAEGPGAGILER